MAAVSTDCKKCHFTMVGVRSSALLMVFVSTFLLCLNPATVSAADVEVDLFGKLKIENVTVKLSDRLIQRVASLTRAQPPTGHGMD